MPDAKIDLLTHLRQLREQIPEDDERIIVIDDLIRDKTHRDNARAAQSIPATSAASVELIPIRAQPSDQTCMPAASPDYRPPAMHRFPSKEVVYIAAPAKSRGLAAVCGLVGAIALLTAVVVLGVVGFVSHPRRTASAGSQAVINNSAP